MDIRAAVECFHLYFSHRLAAKVDRTLFCLKGGCNLRFFFRSIRYSEDIDFDVHTISKDTLRKNVAHLLDDPSFRGPLHNQYAIQIAEWSAPKQTDTTQGWKVQLKVDQQSLTIPTKIEFSRRKTSFEGAAVEPIDSALIARNQMQPILLNHYQLSTAIDQKIQALIGRTETQARDIIDLRLLKDQAQAKLKIAIQPTAREKAIETLLSVSYSDFKSQVWPYLMPEYQSYYDNAEVWNQLQDDVVRYIEDLDEASL